MKERGKNEISFNFFFHENRAPNFFRRKNWIELKKMVRKKSVGVDFWTASHFEQLWKPLWPKTLNGPIKEERGIEAWIGFNSLKWKESREVAKED